MTPNDAGSALEQTGSGLDAAAPARPAVSRALHRAGLLRRIPASWRLPLAVGVGVEAVLLLWWAAFYPGLTSYDSAMYVLQVTVGPWSSDHSVTYDALIWLLLHVPGKLALLTLAQTFATSATLAYTCVALRGLGCRGRWTAPIALLLAVAPPTGAFVVFIWKDVPFTLCSVVVFAASARLIALRATGAPRGDWWALGLALLGLGLFRNNGLGVSLIAGLALAVALPGRRIVLTALTTATVGLSLGCQLFLYPGLGIKPPSVSSVFSLNYHDLAVAYAKSPQSFSAQDKSLLAGVAPSACGPRAAPTATSRISSSVAGGSTARRPSGSTPSSSRSGRTPSRRGRTSCWRPGSAAPYRLVPVPGAGGQERRHLDRLPGYRPENLYGLAAPGSPLAATPTTARSTATPSPRACARRGDLVQQVAGPELDWLVYRGATWCYLAYLAIALYAWRRRLRATLALTGVLVGFQLTVLAANPAPLYRYMVGPLFIGPLCLALIPVALRARRPARAAGVAVAPIRRTAADQVMFSALNRRR